MKNKMVKIAFIILSVVFVFSACMTVFAVTTKSVTESQNGIEATLNFNKQEYNANENVEVTLNVKNNNSYAVKNIQTELIVPSTMKLSKGSLKQEAFSLNAGESKVQEVALEKVVETNNNEPTTNSPQTGDNVVVYIAMMVVSAVALVVIAVKKKWIHKKGVMSLVLCFTLVGAMTLTSVVNAEPTTKEFTVEGTIKYDGEDVVIKGKVTYTHEIYSKLQIDGADKGMYVEGDTVTITAEDAPEGKHFAGWTVVKGNVTLADKNSKTTTFVMGTEEVEIKANYEVDTFTIEVTSGENGKVSPAGSVSVNYGENQEFTITANTGYHIENVEVDGVNKGKIDTYTFDNVKENHTIKATFAINTYTITSTANAGGTITKSATVDYGSSKTFTITPNTGYAVVDVKVDGTSVGAKTSYTFDDVKEQHTIEVVFYAETIVTDATSFRNAVKQDGIIILANDITLDDDGDVEISKNIIIRGNGHKIILPQFMGDNWSSWVIFVRLLSGSHVISENCNFTGTGGLVVNVGAELEVYSGHFNFITNGGSMRMHSGSVNSLFPESYNGFTLLFDVQVGADSEELFSQVRSLSSVEGKNFLDVCSIRGGTFYFDPTYYMDTSKYVANKTKDADGLDIWVVTEK